MTTVRMSNFSPVPLRYSARLFAAPSFLGGVARILDLGATLNEYNENLTIEEADLQAILSDWFAVGDDFRYAINVFAAHSSGEESLHVS